MKHIHQTITRYPLSLLIVLSTLVSLSSTLQATAPSDHSDTQDSDEQTPQSYADQVSAIQNEEKAPLPSGQLLIPVNRQCLYTTIIMGYLLPVAQAKDELTTRIAQLFGLDHADDLDQLRKALENPTDALPYLDSDTFSTLVTSFMKHMSINENTCGGPQELQAIANKLKVNIQEHYPDPSNPTLLMQSDLTQPTQAKSDITLHIVQDKMHPAELLTQADMASGKDSPPYQHYRLKYKLSSNTPVPMLSRQQPYSSYTSLSSVNHLMESYLVEWFEAAKSGQKILLDNLFNNYDININAIDKKRNTALLWSAYYGHLDCLKWLRELKARVNSQSVNNYTALLYSAYNGHLDCVKYLLQQGADIHAKNKKGNTALLISTYQGHVECLKHLIEQGAKVKDKNKKGDTALQMSASNGYAQCLQLLIAECDPEDEDINTALLLSASNGHLACVTLLIEQAPTHALRVKKYKIALQRAKERKQVNVVKKLSKLFQHNQSTRQTRKKRYCSTMPKTLLAISCYK